MPLSLGTELDGLKRQPRRGIGATLPYASVLLTKHQLDGLYDLISISATCDQSGDSQHNHKRPFGFYDLGKNVLHLKYLMVKKMTCFQRPLHL